MAPMPTSERPILILKFFMSALLRYSECGSYVCATAPELIGFRLIFRPRRFLATKLNGRVGFKVERLFQQLFNVSDAVVNALRVEVVNFVSRFQRAEKNVAS